MRRPWGVVTFWGSLGLIAYTYVGFPLLVVARAALRPRPWSPAPSSPTVSIIVAAYNERENIVAKLDSIGALDYPRDRLEVVVASDGSDDGTNELVEAYGGYPVRFLALPRQGKNPTLNAAVEASRGEILVFSDADSTLEPDALRLLVDCFADPQVGGASGSYGYPPTAEGQQGERSYWSFDERLKEFQSRAGSITSATGAGIYAMRRTLFRPVPLGVADDFYNVTRVVAGHQRMLFEPRAKAYGPIAKSSKAEFRRKVRVMVGGLEGVWLARELLDPREHGFFALQLLSHKVLRRLMGIPLALMLLSTPSLWRRGRLYRLAAAAQLGLHGAGLLGFLLRDSRLGRLKPLSLPFFLQMVNVAGIVALISLLRGKRHLTWDRD